MSLKQKPNSFRNISFYKINSGSPCNTLNLSTYLLTKIFSHLSTTYDYKNIRLVCKSFYEICENIKVFDAFENIIKIFFIQNHKLYKVYIYNTFFHNHMQKKYLFRVFFIKNEVKNGLAIEYDSINNIRKRSNFKNGKLYGTTIDYKNNKLYKTTEYIDDIKNGKQIYYHNYYNKRVEKEYILGILLSLKKYFKNYILIDAKFRSNILNGKTIIYSYSANSTINRIKNILFFKNNHLHGSSVIREFDRILKLNYFSGKLEGVQSVYNIDNKLKFLGSYVNGKLNGKYTTFNSYKKIEEGYFSNGKFDKFISIYNISELSKTIYNLKHGFLHGNYIERINFIEIKLSYNYGFFDGKFQLNDVTHGETLEITFYNKNNFIYKKMKFGVEYIIFKKVFGKYSIIIYDIESESHVRHVYNLNNYL